MAQGSPFAWHHLRGVVPADWEVSRFSMEDRVGRLEFANRRGLQATVSWEPCEREPDRLTTMTVFLANNVLGKQAARERNLRVNDVHTAEAGAFVEEPENAGQEEPEGTKIQPLEYDGTIRVLLKTDH